MTKRRMALFELRDGSQVAVSSEHVVLVTLEREGSSILLSTGTILLVNIAPDVVADVLGFDYWDRRYHH